MSQNKFQQVLYALVGDPTASETSSGMETPTTQEEEKPKKKVPSQYYSLDEVSFLLPRTEVSTGWSGWGHLDEPKSEKEKKGMKYQDIKHGQKLLFKYKGQEAVVTHMANVSVPMNRDAYGRPESIWVTGYYPDRPDQGAFVMLEHLSPYETENEFGPISP